MKIYAATTAAGVDAGACDAATTTELAPVVNAGQISGAADVPVVSAQMIYAIKGDQGEKGDQGDAGPPGPNLGDSFESFSKNLRSADAVRIYDPVTGDLQAIEYADGITKTLVRSPSGALTSIVLSGAGLPAGVATRKVLANDAGEPLGPFYTDILG